MLKQSNSYCLHGGFQNIFFRYLTPCVLYFVFFPTLCAFIPGRSKRDIRNVININMLISDCMLINSHVNVTMIVCCIYSHCCIVNINIVLLYHWQPEDFGSCRSVLTFLLFHLQSCPHTKFHSNCTENIEIKTISHRSVLIGWSSQSEK